MKDLINQYKFEADRLAKYTALLRKELDGQGDMEIFNRLTKRIRLLETERYEILRDISDMKSGLKSEGLKSEGLKPEGLNPEEDG